MISFRKLCEATKPVSSRFLSEALRLYMRPYLLKFKGGFFCCFSSRKINLYFVGTNLYVCLLYVFGINVGVQDFEPLQGFKILNPYTGQTYKGFPYSHLSLLPTLPFSCKDLKLRKKPYFISPFK